MSELKPFRPPVSYEDASSRAGKLLNKLSISEKIDMIGGHDFFFARGYPEHGIPQLYFSDATAGVHIRRQLDNRLEKSVAFPAPIALAATWNPALAQEVAQAIGEECRAGGIAVLLGPGMNIYRISQCGRNFEYFGEDPFLAAKMIEHFVVGVQSTGTIATLKHFVCNNTDFHRRRSNSIVNDRTLHEIYLPAFKAGVDAGAMAVMTSYNQLNGEWAGQSKYVIDALLRKDLGFKWLVMTDWWSTYDPAKVIKSGQDLEMPGSAREGDPSMEKLGDVYLRSNAARLLSEGKIDEADIDRMAKSILTTEIAMGLMDREVKDESYLAKFPAHEKLALQEAREGIVLLKNENYILPITETKTKKILLTGEFVTKLPAGGGSSFVEGYNVVTMLDAFRDEFGESLRYIEKPTDEDVREADVILVSIGTEDSEGWDRPFELSSQTDGEISKYAGLNPNVVVIVNSGGGIRMMDWNSKVAGIIYAWYPGQAGNRALAEVVSGMVNPSGKLPITIERNFADSPGHSYIPEGEKLYIGPKSDLDPSIPVYDIEYKEGIFVGYRWYESKHIEPLYHFGYGLSYATFEITDLAVSREALKKGDTLDIEFTVKNSGGVAGAEVAQLYVSDLNRPLPRPVKELKGFKKVFLNPGESKRVRLKLAAKDFSYWDTGRQCWYAHPGAFSVLVGASSDDIRLSAKVTLED